jgi:uncharacterized protein YwgA
MKAKDLILRILQARPNLPTTRLAKLCYLFDLACIELLGKQKTELPYKWDHYGPHCEEFERAVWDLEESGKIKIEPYRTAEQYDCYLHSAVDNTAPNLGEIESKILEYIISRFAEIPTDKLREFVYSTPPMVEAQHKRQRFQKLNMKSKEGISSTLLDPETAKMILSAREDIRNRKTSSLDAFLKKWENQKASA